MLINLMLAFGLHSTAQWYDPDKVGKKARQIYEQAYDKAVNGDYRESLTLLQSAIVAEPRYVEAYLSRAGIHADMKDYRSSVADFEKAFSLDSVFSSTYLLPYSISLAGIGEFDKALARVTGFLSTPGLNQQSIRAGNYRKSVYQFAIAYRDSTGSDKFYFDPKNAGDSINSSNHEYFPSVTVDGKKLVITRRVDNDEDFYESDRNRLTWSAASPLRGKINTNLNEGAQNISQDGQWLVFTGCNYPEGMGSCDLYISYRTKNGGWTEPENLGSKINSDAWESSPSLSPDKKELYFSSNRPGGYGGKDIWVSRRRPEGGWGEPVNLGPSINTSGDEGCPFMHADNSSFYFNSNGWPGYGATDLFLSRKTNDSTWQTPLNLGYPINTIDDEGSLVIASDGQTGYYASDRGDTRGGLDIYSFILRPDLRAAKTTWVRGRVYDSKSTKGLPSTVELTETNTRRTVSRLQTDEDGNYLVTLPQGRSYVFNVKRKGYLFYSDHFEITNMPEDSFLVVDIPLKPIEAGASIILKNIFFETGKTNLDQGSIVELDQLVQLLNDNPAMRVMISGHTDNTGRKEDNMNLSLSRARSVVQYLLSRGISTNRLVPKGFGDTRPIASNDTEQGKSLNRRTELNVIAN